MSQQWISPAAEHGGTWPPVSWAAPVPRWRRRPRSGLPGRPTAVRGAQHTCSCGTRAPLGEQRVCARGAGLLPCRSGLPPAPSGCGRVAARWRWARGARDEVSELCGEGDKLPSETSMWTALPARLADRMEKPVIYDFMQYQSFPALPPPMAKEEVKASKRQIWYTHSVPDLIFVCWWMFCNVFIIAIIILQ